MNSNLPSTFTPPAKIGSEIIVRTTEQGERNQISFTFKNYPGKIFKFLVLFFCLAFCFSSAGAQVPFGACSFDNTNNGNTKSIKIGLTAFSEIDLGVTPPLPSFYVGANASVSASGTNEFEYGGSAITNNSGASLSHVLVSLTKIAFWTQNIAGTAYQPFVWDLASQTWKGKLGNGQDAYFKVASVTINGTLLPSSNIKLMPIQSAAAGSGYHLIESIPTFTGTNFTDGGTGTSYNTNGSVISLPQSMLVADLGPLAAGATMLNIRVQMQLVMPSGGDAWVQYTPDGSSSSDVDYYFYGYVDIWGLGYDYGDAPASYGKASHKPGLCSPAIYIGPNREDFELSITGSAAANKDDNNLSGYNDETSNLPILTGQPPFNYTIALPYVNNAVSGVLSAWIDWDGSGTFDASERAYVTVPNGSGSASLTWVTSGATTGQGTVFSGVTRGAKMVRLRISSVAADVANPSGVAADGEVEDLLMNVGYPLPVSLVSFGVAPYGTDAKITWMNEEEENTASYTVERSTDGLAFTSLQTITATKGKNYSIIDAAPLKGISYYRLKVNGKDASYEYSKIAKLSMNGVSIISATPNPFANRISVKVLVSKAMPVNISITDMMGRKVYQEVRNANSGSNTVLVDGLDKLNKGAYVLTITTEEATIQQRMIKE